MSDSSSLLSNMLSYSKGTITEEEAQAALDSGAFLHWTDTEWSSS